MAQQYHLARAIAHHTHGIAGLIGKGTSEVQGLHAVDQISNRNAFAAGRAVNFYQIEESFRDRVRHRISTNNCLNQQKPSVKKVSKKGLAKAMKFQ